MKKQFFKRAMCFALTAVMMSTLAACGNSGTTPKSTPSVKSVAASNGEPEVPVTIKQSENAFKDYTVEQFAAIPFADWCKKADEVGIAYEFNGQYTEAYAIQLNPTYFDAYLYKDGSVYATYNADYVASARAQNGGGDGHEDKAAFLGWWYNVSDDGDTSLIIQWVSYMDHSTGHTCKFDTQSPAMWGGSSYQAAVSLAHNGNSRTCFIYGNVFSPYKKDTLKVDTSAAPTVYDAANEIQSPKLRITCERENSATPVEVPTYLFDYSFDAAGNVTIDYPILGLKDTTSYKVTINPTVYATTGVYDGESVDVKITRDTSDTAVLEVDGKTARFSYKVEYYRNIFTVDGYVEDAANTMTAAEFAKFTTKYYFMGECNPMTVTNNDGTKTDTFDVAAKPDGNVLTPEIAHYAMKDPAHKAWAHAEPNKGPGVWSDGYELVQFENFLFMRYFVTSNAEYINMHALYTTVEEAGIMYTRPGGDGEVEVPVGAIHISDMVKYGNNVNGRFTSQNEYYVLDADAMTVDPV